MTGFERGGRARKNDLTGAARLERIGTRSLVDRARCSDRGSGEGIAGEGIENEFGYLGPLSGARGLNAPVYTAERFTCRDTCLAVSISRSNRVKRVVLVTSFDRGTVIGELSDQAVAPLALCLPTLRSCTRSVNCLPTHDILCNTYNCRERKPLLTMKLVNGTLSRDISLR